MKQILVTGATGNIGSEVIHYLNDQSSDYRVIAAVRDLESSKEKLSKYPSLSFRHFDFEDPQTFNKSFEGIDILFLLRPPHISDVKKVFQPLLESAKENNIKCIVFLSVQGAEKSKVIPHNKIERLIRDLGFSFIFVRPSYFMQNLTTTLRSELVENHSITLPSGKAKFNWIDVKNIGEATAKLIINFEKNKNKAFEITGRENKNFQQVVDLITKITGIDFQFKSINPISFYFKKKKMGLESGYAFILTLLHFLPRFQSEPAITENYTMLTGKKPTSLKQFIDREKSELIS